ncbi:MAG: DUF4129 domain-containing protein [Leptolyngbya sp. BL-A-14]
MAGSFEKNSFGWQFHLLQQRLSEWLEQLFAPIGRRVLPHWSLPDWLLRLLFWIILGSLISWVVWQLYQLVRPYFATLAIAQKGQANPQAQVERPLTVTAWLQRSRTFAQQGDYREACRALYMAALQRLNDKEPIPYEPSRTDGEYLRLVETIPRSAPYRVLLRTHEQLCFSNAEITADAFDRCQQAYQDIEASGGS